MPFDIGKIIDQRLGFYVIRTGKGSFVAEKQRNNVRYEGEHCMLYSAQSQYKMKGLHGCYKLLYMIKKLVKFHIIYFKMMFKNMNVNNSFDQVCIFNY